MWRRCCCCCCPKQTSRRQPDLSERPSQISEHELQGLNHDLEALHSTLESERERGSELEKQREEALAENQIYKATERELKSRLDLMKTKERESRKLQENNEALKVQAAKLMEARTMEKTHHDHRVKSLSDLKDSAASLRTQTEALTAKKRSMEKDVERAKSRLEAAQNTLGKLKARESEIARHTSKAVESSRALARRTQLLNLQLIWSRVLLNSQRRCFHHWQETKLY